MSRFITSFTPDFSVFPVAILTLEMAITRQSIRLCEQLFLTTDFFDLENHKGEQHNHSDWHDELKHHFTENGQRIMLRCSEDQIYGIRNVVGQEKEAIPATNAEADKEHRKASNCDRQHHR